MFVSPAEISNYTDVQKQAKPSGLTQSKRIGFATHIELNVPLLRLDQDFKLNWSYCLLRNSLCSELQIKLSKKKLFHFFPGFFKNPSHLSIQVSRHGRSYVAWQKGQVTRKCSTIYFWGTTKAIFLDLWCQWCFLQIWMVHWKMSF